jgi:hypothetical protein
MESAAVGTRTRNTARGLSFAKLSRCEAGMKDNTLARILAHLRGRQFLSTVTRRTSYDSRRWPRRASRLQVSPP